jgi:tRNA A37 methylthiotransferase MiaB
MRRQSEISLELNEARVGSVLKVLVEGVAEGRSHRFDARTEFDAPEVDNSVQIVDGDAEPGTFAMVRVVGATEYDLEAVVE